MAGLLTRVLCPQGLKCYFPYWNQTSRKFERQGWFWFLLMRHTDLQNDGERNSEHAIANALQWGPFFFFLSLSVLCGWSWTLVYTTVEEGPFQILDEPQFDYNVHLARGIIRN